MKAKAISVLYHFPFFRSLIQSRILLTSPNGISSHESNSPLPLPEEGLLVNSFLLDLGLDKAHLFWGGKPTRLAIIPGFWRRFPPCIFWRRPLLAEFR